MDESDGNEEEANGVIRVKDFGRRLANQASISLPRLVFYTFSAGKYRGECMHPQRG